MIRQHGNGLKQKSPDYNAPEEFSVIEMFFYLLVITDIWDCEELMKALSAELDGFKIM